MTGATLRVPSRFNGPPGSGNGGYTCGLVAAVLAAEAAEITLRTPPPLERDLAVERDGEAITVLHEGKVVAEGHAAQVDLEVPEPPSVERAGEAARAGYLRWSAEHPFPGCVVCGPGREPGDGLRLFPGPLSDEDLFACSWTPHESVADGSGTVLPECVWAALDCPTSAPIGNYGEGPPMVLARLAASLEAPVRAGEPHVIVSWEIERGGRKRTAGAALYDSQDTVLGRSRATWIELREGKASPAR